jgi:hypothetical protein
MALKITQLNKVVDVFVNATPTQVLVNELSDMINTPYISNINVFLAMEPPYKNNRNNNTRFVGGNKRSWNPANFRMVTHESIKYNHNDMRNGPFDKNKVSNARKNLFGVLKNSKIKVFFTGDARDERPFSFVYNKDGLKIDMPPKNMNESQKKKLEETLSNFENKSLKNGKHRTFMADVLCLSKVYNYKKKNDDVNTYDINLSFNQLIQDYPNLDEEELNPDIRFTATVIRWSDYDKTKTREIFSSFVTSPPSGKKFDNAFVWHDEYLNDIDDAFANKMIKKMYKRTLMMKNYRIQNSGANTTVDGTKSYGNPLTKNSRGGVSAPGGTGRLTRTETPQFQNSGTRYKNIAPKIAGEHPLPKIRGVGIRHPEERGDSLVLKKHPNPKSKLAGRGISLPKSRGRTPRMGPTRTGKPLTTKSRGRDSAPGGTGRLTRTEKPQFQISGVGV